MRDLIFLQGIVTSGVIATVSILGNFVARVQAATFTLPIEAAAKATGVDVLRDRYGLDGTGITIGVISDSFATAETFNAFGNLDTYATNIADSYLPSGINVLKDYAEPDTDDEGRALLQLIHAVAPGAKLAFHTDGGNVDTFGQAIQALAAAGANIIVDDIGYGYPPAAPPDAPLNMFDLEPPNGPINQAIDAVFNQGIFYFTDAGNDFSRGIPIYGHSNNPNALTVGAVYYGNAEFYVSRVDGAVIKQGEVEPFSSEGNPGSLKPDVVAPDGLPISFNLGGDSPLDDDPRFFRLFGTSASAPYTAAVAALLQQANPNATPTEIYDALRNTAESSLPGFDSSYGYGLIRADRAVLALGVQPRPITIPEPSAAPALLGVSVLIAGILLKRSPQRFKAQKLTLVYSRVDKLSYKPLTNAS